MKTTMFSKAKLHMAIKGAVALPLVMSLSAPALAQSNAELERRIEALEAQLESASSSQAPEVTGENVYVVSDGSGFTFGGTTFTLGGFVKADMIFGSNGDGTTNNYATGTPNILAGHAYSGQNDWQVGFSARETRISIGTATPSDIGTIKTYVEFDFQQSSTDGGNEYVSNGYVPRLRQAYGSWNGLTIGQTYSVFTDLAVLPENLNQGKHAGFIYATQPQIRYTMGLGAGSSLMMALENPEDGLSGSFDDQSIPDITARYNLRGSMGMYSIAAMARQLVTPADEAWGGAVALSARIPTFGRDDLRLQYAYGAMGRYNGLAAFTSLDPVEEAVTGDAEVANSQLMTAAYRHFWTPSLRSNFIVSHTEEVDPNAGRTFDYATSSQVNLIWQPAESMSYGIQYSFWNFKHAGDTDAGIAPGDKENYQQVMLSAKYDF